MLGDDELVEKGEGGRKEERGDAIKEMKRESESREFAISLREAEKRRWIFACRTVKLLLVLKWLSFLTCPPFFLGNFMDYHLILMEFNGVKKNNRNIEFCLMFHIISPRLPCAKQT